MNIIGIHDGHNATVALLQDGAITFVVSEERLTRKKNQGGFPARALDRVMQETRLEPADIARVVFSTKRPHMDVWFQREKLLERYRATMDGDETASSWASRAKRCARAWLNPLRSPVMDANRGEREEARLQPLRERGFVASQLYTLDHHTSHALSAYYANGDREHEMLVLTNDGGGDGLCATVSMGKDGVVTRLAETSVRYSFAALYARATFLMGMMPLEHEYKLMGLAPYAHAERASALARKLEAFFEWPDDAPLTWRLRDSESSVNHLASELKRLFYLVRFDTMAAAMQLFIERMALAWIGRCIQETGVRRLVLSGGLFMNVKLNQRILALPEVESVYVIPSCGDESTPMGACYWGARQEGIEPNQLRPLTHLYLGPTYETDEMEAAMHAIPTQGIVVEQPDDLAHRIAELLAAGEIVALYHGREEFGARALGARSLLADPSRLESIRRLNKMIKNRDFWMPFAGSMTEKQAMTLLKNPKRHAAPYMMMAFDVQEGLDEIRAATHPYDETIRPQVVTREWHPLYYDIMDQFQRRTGRPACLLNTSFNLHGFPIVSSPKDALEVFYKSGLRHLVLGKQLLSKPAQMHELYLDRSTSTGVAA